MTESTRGRGRPSGRTPVVVERGEQLAAELASPGVTQRALAHLHGLSETTISRNLAATAVTIEPEIEGEGRISEQGLELVVRGIERRRAGKSTRRRIPLGEPFAGYLQKRQPESRTVIEVPPDDPSVTQVRDLQPTGQLSKVFVDMLPKGLRRNNGQEQ